MRSVRYTYRNQHGIRSITLALLLLVVTLSSVYVPRPVVAGANYCDNASDTCSFAGYTWKIVPGSATYGPAAHWSDSPQNVWVDQQGQLHLALTHSNGVWYSSEVYLNHSLGYGTYTFYLATRIDQLDKNVVGGLFTYESDTRELDIEFSKWSGTTCKWLFFCTNADYAVQPFDHNHPNNGRLFNIALSGTYTTHFLTWAPGTATFQSINGHYASPPGGGVIKQWSFPPKGSSACCVPPSDGNERVEMNMWLIPPATAPARDGGTELIISGFSFQPLTQQLTTGADSGSGTITINPQCTTPGCSEQVNSSVAVTAKPSSGWQFTRWSTETGVSCSSNPCTFLMPNNAVNLKATFTRFSSCSNTVLQTISVGTYPQGVAFDSHNNELYVTNGISDSVSVISDSTNAVIMNITSFDNPMGITFDPHNNRLYFANSYSKTVSVISDSTNTVINTVSVPGQPWDVAFDSNNNDVYVSLWIADAVAVISDSTNTVVATIPVGSSPEAISFDPHNNEVYVANNVGESVSVISATTNTVIATIGFSSTVTGLAFDSHNNEVYVSASEAGDVFVISDSTNTVVASIPDGNGGPTGIAFDPHNDEVYVTNFLGPSVYSISYGNLVTVISDSSNTVVANITVGYGPMGIAFDPHNNEMYVANFVSNSVSAICTA